MSEPSRSSTTRRLRRLLFGSSEPTTTADDSLRVLHTRLGAIEHALDALTLFVQSSASTPSLQQAADEQFAPGAASAIEQRLAALEKQINRAGREQLKQNVLIESQTEHQRVALAALQTANERRDAEVLGLREQLRAAQQTTRLEMVRALLPVLDSLDEAYRSGSLLLTQAQHPVRRRGLFGRGQPETPPAERMLRENMAAWLEGLCFVRQRLLDLLAAEGVVPMDADGQLFDPHQHIVLDVVAATDQPSGTVLTTLRQGYSIGEHVLRHAEVSVAGAPTRHEGHTAREP